MNEIRLELNLDFAGKYLKPEDIERVVKIWLENGVRTWNDGRTADCHIKLQRINVLSVKG